MKLTVLTDNNTIIDDYLLGEPALSILIETDNKKILFDTGYSDIFIKNAMKMDINLQDIDYLVLSHGHNDHTHGLTHLLELYSKTKPNKKIELITHPLTFNSKLMKNIGEIGSLETQDSLVHFFDIKLTKKPFWITENLVFLGEIPRKNTFESKKCIGQICIDNVLQNDYLYDDSALAYKSSQGLVTITGCSHAGICNIVEYTKQVCNENKFVDIIGGLHLLEPGKEQLSKTLKYLEKLELQQIHPCHCTDLHSKISISKVANIKEVGSGLKLNYN